MVFTKKQIKGDIKEKDDSFQGNELDIVEIPIEAVAAFWLSIKKIARKKWEKIAQEEEKYTSEPFIKHILGLILSGFDDNKVYRLAEYKMKTLLKEFQRRFIIISIGLLGISSKENPRQVLIRIMSKFPLPPTTDNKIYKNAQLLLKSLEQGENTFVDIYHRHHPEILITNLLFYSMLSRRKGVGFCLEKSKGVRSHIFRDGLSLIADGFETEFIKYRLNLQQREILYDTEQKMKMSIEMALAVRNRVSYEDMFKIANSFMI